MYFTIQMIERELTIVVADDNHLVREGILNVVKRMENVIAVRGATNGKEALELLKKNTFDLILMDLDMPEMDGFDASIEVLKKYPNTKILVLSAHDDENVIYHLIEMRVHGFVPKNSTPQELVEAINNVIQKGFHFDDMAIAAMRKGIIRKSEKPIFTPKVDITEREKNILKLMCAEKTTREIGDEIALSERTVEKIRAALASKLDVKGTAGLVRYAVQNGLDM